MRKNLVLTEEQVTSLIREAVENTIDEANNNSILMGIAEKITDMGEIKANIGENELYDQIEIGEYHIDINYTVETDSYWGGAGDPGDYYHEPQEPDLVEGETRVFVNQIWVNTDENDDVMNIEDNGIIANALKSVIVLDELDYPDRTFEYDEPDSVDEY
jgi:hypothetical protein